MSVLIQGRNAALMKAALLHGGEGNLTCQDFVGCVTGAKLGQFLCTSHLAGEVQCQVLERLLLQICPVWILCFGCGVFTYTTLRTWWFQHNVF